MRLSRLQKTFFFKIYFFLIISDGYNNIKRNLKTREGEKSAPLQSQNYYNFEVVAALIFLGGFLLKITVTTEQGQGVLDPFMTKG